MYYFDVSKVQTMPLTIKQNPSDNEPQPQNTNEEKSISQPEREEGKVVPTDKTIPLKKNPSENSGYSPLAFLSLPTDKTVVLGSTAANPEDSIFEEQSKPIALPNSYFKPDSPSDPDPFPTFPKEKIEGKGDQKQSSPEEISTSAPNVKEITNTQPKVESKMSIADFEAEEALFNR